MEGLQRDIELLMLELQGKGRGTPDQIKRMFTLHNQLYPQMRENGRSCSTCVARVYKRLQNYHAALIAQNNDKGGDN